jgi:glycosyltransferase involved in cell wall biosynthesis
MWDGVAMVLAAKAKVPIRIVHSHNDISRYLSENIFKRLYFKASISVGKKNSTSGLACSELAGASYFGRHWKQDRRWSLLLCGEDLSAFQHSIDRRAVRYELGFHGDVFVVGHVGSFRSEQKNHSFIIRIFADIARVDKRARLLFVGDGSLRPRIEKEVRKMGLADLVVFAGSRDDVPRLLVGAMDLFLFPSRFEGLGLVLVEAQAAGLPSVCSDVIPEEADLGTGLVKKVSLDRSPSEWVQEIIAHRNFCSRISREAAFETVERSRFNLKRSMNELQDIYLGENAIRMSRQMHDEKK